MSSGESSIELYLVVITKALFHFLHLFHHRPHNLETAPSVQSQPAGENAGSCYYKSNMAPSAVYGNADDLGIGYENPRFCCTKPSDHHRPDSSRQRKARITGLPFSSARLSFLSGVSNNSNAGAIVFFGSIMINYFVKPSASMIASANALGASCGRLCPTPPLIVLCTYLPLNFFA